MDIHIIYGRKLKVNYGTDRILFIVMRGHGLTETFKKGYKMTEEFMSMKDPLGNFEWDFLYQKYDYRCMESNRFKPNSEHLYAFEPRPKSDRELYARILERVNSEKHENQIMSLATYEAIIYWKMYSTSPKINNDIQGHPDRQKDLRARLLNLSDFPKNLTRDSDEVIKVTRWMLDLCLYGMGLPVATTVLHFLYPNIIPIFDQMVLRAVGYAKEKARVLNQSFDVFQGYLPHHWSLADKYSIKLVSFSETPVRLVDMALWVVRGTEQSQNSELSKNSRIKESKENIDQKHLLKNNKNTKFDKAKDEYLSKINFSNQKIGIWDKVANVFKDRDGEIFSREEIINIVVNAYPETNRKSVIPTDYCYNKINKDPSSFQLHLFEWQDEGQFNCLGLNYKYDGPIIWKEEQVGEWKSGQLCLWKDPRNNK